jgi:hypothetical protein
LEDKRCAFYGDASSYFLFHVTVVSWNLLLGELVIQRGNLVKSVNEGRGRMFRLEAELFVGRGGGGIVIEGRNFMTNNICLHKIRTLDIA